MRTPLLLGRYIFREVAAPFFLGAFILSFVALMPQVLREAEKVLAFGISLEGVARLIAYSLPQILLFVVPASFLLGILVAFGRLSTDSEMIAIRAGGVSLWQLLPSVLLLGIFVSAVTAVMSLYGDAWGRDGLRMFIYDLGLEKASGLIRPHTFNDDFFNLVIFAGDVVPEESLLKDVFIADEHDPATGVLAVRARQGVLVNDKVHTSIVLELSDGTIDRIAPDPSQGITRISFRRMDYNVLPETTTYGPGEKDPYEMGPIELWRHLHDPTKEHTGRDWMSFYKKFAYPVSCLLLGVIGMALGIHDPRRGKATGYGMGLVAMLGYYLLVRMGDATGEGGQVPPVVAVWLPDVLFALIGFWLFIAKAGERDTFLHRLVGGA